MIKRSYIAPTQFIAMLINYDFSLPLKSLQKNIYKYFQFKVLEEDVEGAAQSTVRHFLFRGMRFGLGCWWFSVSQTTSDTHITLTSSQSCVQLGCCYPLHQLCQLEAWPSVSHIATNHTSHHSALCTTLTSISEQSIKQLSFWETKPGTVMHILKNILKSSSE